MAHVGTAMKLNSESLWFNPAAAAFQNEFFDFRPVSRASPRGHLHLAARLRGYAAEPFPSPITTSRRPSTSTPTSKPTPWMSAGLVFNTPFGSSMNWGDDWAGAHLIQSINLKAYNLQPTVSFRIGKHVSVGAGLMLTWGSFDLSRRALSGGSTDQCAARRRAATGPAGCARTLRRLRRPQPDVDRPEGRRKWPWA